VHAFVPSSGTILDGGIAFAMFARALARNPASTGEVLFLKTHRSRMSSAQKVPRLEYAILVIATFLALELKRPFGLLAHQVLGPAGTAPSGAPYALGAFEYVQLAAVLLACTVHQATGLPAAPWLERVLYGWHADEKLRIWLPALAGVLVTLLYTAVYTLIGAQFGLTSKLGAQLHGPTLPHAVIIRLAALYPLAAIGAAISEELVYRFALISLAVAVVYLFLPRARAAPWAVLWPIIVLGGFFFGYVHVVENIETASTGNIALDVLTTPQSWAGIVFGYVYCRYGLESAMIAHGLSDLLAPFLLRLLHAA
jgi:hypothetical protein